MNLQKPIKMAIGSKGMIKIRLNLTAFITNTHLVNWRDSVNIVFWSDTMTWSHRITNTKRLLGN